MILEETVPSRILDLLAACEEQHGMILRLIVEGEPAFQPSKIRMLLGSRRWPAAVNPNLIIAKNSDHDQFARAESILDQLVHQPLTGKKFLDFGCGAGYVARQATRQGADAVGYDIDQKMTHMSDTLLTQDWDAVLSRAPYDIALVYDVLDHTQEEHPIDCLKKIRNVMTPEGIIVVRCHPWCSRTGNHSYSVLNKAYLHYFFTQEQLEEMGCPGIYTRKITHPIVTYDDWFLKSGLTKVSEDVKREPLEPIWEEDTYLRKMIVDHWSDSYETGLADGTKFPKYQLEQQFVDFTLKLS